MEEKIFAGILTAALLLAFVFSIEALANFQRPQKVNRAVHALSSDLQILGEQLP